MAADVIAPPPGFQLDAAPAAPVAPEGLPALPEGFQLDTPQQPDSAKANDAFARTLTNALARVKSAAGTAFETVNAGVEAAANTIVGLATFPVSLVGAGMHTAQAWLNGEKDVSFDKSFGQMSQFLNEPLYSASSEKGQDYTDAIGDMFNRVLIPMGAHLAVHPAAPRPLVERARLLPSMIRDEWARKLNGQTVTAEDMGNVAKVVAGDKPESAPHVERSLRGIYDETGIGPFTIAAEAERDPKLKADLMDPEVVVPEVVKEATKAEEPPAEPPAPAAPPVDPAALAREDLTAHDLADTPESRVQVATVAEASRIDPEGVRAAAERHADDEPAFMQAVQEIIRANEEQGASAAERGNGGGAEASRAAETGPGAEPADVAGPDAAAKPAVDLETAKQNLIDLRKRESVLNALLECLA